MVYVFIISLVVTSVLPVIVAITLPENLDEV